MNARKDSLMKDNLIEAESRDKLARLRAEAERARLLAGFGWRSRLAGRLRDLADRLEPAQNPAPANRSQPLPH